MSAAATGATSTTPRGAKSRIPAAIASAWACGGQRDTARRLRGYVRVLFGHSHAVWADSWARTVPPRAEKKQRAKGGHKRGLAQTRPYPSQPPHRHESMHGHVCEVSTSWGWLNCPGASLRAHGAGRAHNWCPGTSRPTRRRTRQNHGALKGDATWKSIGESRKSTIRTQKSILCCKRVTRASNSISKNATAQLFSSSLDVITPWHGL